MYLMQEKFLREEKFVFFHGSVSKFPDIAFIVVLFKTFILKYRIAGNFRKV